LHEVQAYVLAASLQLSHLQIKISPQLGHLNFTHLSFGIMCLWQQSHVGKDMVDDIPQFFANIIYTLLRNKKIFNSKIF